MRQAISLTEKEIAEWEKIKKNLDNDQVVIEFLQKYAKRMGLIILAGVNTVAPIYFGGKPEWQFVTLASKPRSGYLKCLGNYFKIYPDGKVMYKGSNGQFYLW